MPTATRPSASRLLSVILLCALPAACAARNTGSSSVQDSTGAEDVAGTESDLEALGSSFLGSDGHSLATASVGGAPDLRLESVPTSVGNPGFWFQPAGCLEVTSDPANKRVTYAFNGCTGPLGLVSLTGTVAVDYQVDASETLTLSYSAQAFKINRATIESWQAQAVITSSGGARDMTWTASLTGVTGRGRPFSRTNQKHLKWTVGEPCLSVSGQSSGTVLRARLETTITNFQRCADACPQAGSEIQVKNLDSGDSIDLLYEGGPHAVLTVNGRVSDIGLACGD